MGIYSHLKTPSRFPLSSLGVVFRQGLARGEKCNGGEHGKKDFLSETTYFFTRR